MVIQGPLWRIVLYPWALKLNHNFKKIQLNCDQVHIYGFFIHKYNKN